LIGMPRASVFLLIKLVDCWKKKKKKRKGKKKNIKKKIIKNNKKIKLKILKERNPKGPQI
jgi:hypothetical protein